MEATIEEKYYIAACRYAIHQITKTGSDYFTIVDGNAALYVSWDNVLNWLDKREIAEDDKDENDD